MNAIYDFIWILKYSLISIKWDISCAYNLVYILGSWCLFIESTDSVNIWHHSTVQTFS